MTMTADIIIEGYNFNRVSSVEIESGWDLLTDTAEIKIPRALYFASKTLKDAIKVGSPVVIALGYNGNNNIEFQGYVTKLTTDVPVVISCQDSMWKLKQTSVNKVFKNASLSDLLTSIIPEPFTFEAADLHIGNLICEKTTVAKVLQTLKDEYRIYSYFKGGVLISGKIYTDNSETVKYNFEKNIASHDLKYCTADDLKIKITAECIKNDGTKITESVGDTDGEESKLVYSGNHTKEQLKKLAELDLKRMKVEGYKGSINAFGLPFVQHGYTAVLDSTQAFKPTGNYYIDAVSTSFTNAGFKRTIKIGGQASEQK